MDRDQPPPASTRKVRFKPKPPPPRRTPNPTVPQTVAVDDTSGSDDDASLLRRANDNLVRRGPSVGKKSSQVVFGQGAVSSTSLRTCGTPREGSSGKSTGSVLKDSADEDDEHIPFSLPSTAEPAGTTESNTSDSDESSPKKKEPYIEPWDCHPGNYPISLPLRRPHSGDPEILNEAEFGDAARNLVYDEDAINPALELGLLEENDKLQLLFLQIPANLPRFEQSASAFGKKSKGASAGAKGKGIATGASAGAKGKGIAAGASAAAQGEGTVGSSETLKPENAPKMCCGLEDLPAGHMGKMLVYKSGAIKWKLGDTLFDVSPGVSTSFAQDAVAVNTVDKNCCVVGELGKRAVVTPDIDSLLDSAVAPPDKSSTYPT